MKNLIKCLLEGSLILTLLLQSCDLEFIAPSGTDPLDMGLCPPYVNCKDTLKLSSLLGDKDGIGIGLVEGAVWSPTTSGINTWPIDYREDDDPEFTDIYPTGLDGIIEYTHSYDIQTDSILFGKFIFTTLGIQDGDKQVYQSDTDILFFIDGFEIEAAFDDVDQFDYYDGKWMSSVSTIEVTIPQHLIYNLLDNKVVVRWEIMQLGTSPGIDAIAIDYSELVITYCK